MQQHWLGISARRRAFWYSRWKSSWLNNSCNRVVLHTFNAILQIGWHAEAFCPIHDKLLFTVSTAAYLLPFCSSPTPSAAVWCASPACLRSMNVDIARYCGCLRQTQAPIGWLSASSSSLADYPISSFPDHQIIHINCETCFIPRPLPCKADAADELLFSHAADPVVVSQTWKASCQPLWVLVPVRAEQ